jgi:hypothetical protein
LPRSGYILSSLVCKDKKKKITPIHGVTEPSQTDPSRNIHHKWAVYYALNPDNGLDSLSIPMRNLYFNIFKGQKKLYSSFW